MKAVVFTTDALFSLIIAATGVTVLLYFVYTPAGAAQLSYSGTQSILESFASLHLSQISNSSAMARQIENQNLAYAFQWNQYKQGGGRWAYGTYGPASAYLDYMINGSNTITVPPVAASGALYFAVANVISAANASQGGLMWDANIGIYPVNSIAEYNNLLFYSSANVLGALDTQNGTAAWNSIQGTVPSSKILVYEGKILYAAGNYISAVYANNGTLAWQSARLPLSPNSLAIVNGSLAAGSSGDGGLALFTESGGMLWYQVPPSPLSTGIGAFDGMITYGSGADACAVYTSGAQAFCQDLGSNVIGIAATTNTVIYQTYNSIAAISTSGLVLWSAPSAYGVGTGYPVASSGAVYSEWLPNNITADSISGGGQVWATSAPYGVVGNSILAYGRLYSTFSGNILSYGACPAGDTVSLLASIATLYLSKDGSCADYLANEVYSMANYSITINNTLAPYQLAAEFNGISGSYIKTGATGLVGGNGGRAAFAWIYFSGSSALGTRYPIYAYGNDIIAGEGAYLSIANGRLNFSAGGADFVEYSSNIMPYSWNFVGYNYTEASNTMTLYVNGNSETFALPLDAPLDTVISKSDPSDIGRYPNTAAFAFNGMITDLQTYGKGLSANEIVALYHGGIAGAPLPLPSLTSWYPLDGDANDYGPANNTGYIVDAGYAYTGYAPRSLTDSFAVSKASSIIPISSPAAFFGGAGSDIKIQSGPALDYNPITVSAWVSPGSSCVGGSSLCAVITVGSNTLLAVAGGNFQGRLPGFVGMAGGGPDLRGRWYYIAETYDGSTQKLYVDGNLVGSVIVSPASLVPSSGLDIGGNQLSPSYTNFQGYLANVQVYDSALSQAAVLALYNKGVQGTPASGEGLAGWWPLSGNANDYSGQGNGGVASEIGYNASSGLYNAGVLVWK